MNNSGGRTRKQCSTTIQPQPPSGGSSYLISFSFSFLLVIAFFLNRFMAALVSLGEKRKISVTQKSHRQHQQLLYKVMNITKCMICLGRENINSVIAITAQTQHLDSLYMLYICIKVLEQYCVLIQYQYIRKRKRHQTHFYHASEAAAAAFLGFEEDKMWYECPYEIHLQ